MRLGNIIIIAKYLLLSSRGWIYVSLGFMLMFPVLWLILLRIVGNPQYMNYFIVGTVVNSSFLVPFIGAAQDMAYFRRGSSIYTLLYSNGADHWDIAIGYIIHGMIYSVPSIIALFLSSILIMGMSYGITQLTITVAVASLIALSSALLGYALAMGIKNYRVVQQLSQIIPWPLILLAPVYYPITILPTALRYVSLALPTTYMAFAINGALGLDLNELFIGLLGVFAYSLASILITKHAIVRGEVSG